MDWALILTVVTAVVTGASVVLKVVAPLTASRADDKLLAALTWVLEKISLNTALPK